MNGYICQINSCALMSCVRVSCVRVLCALTIALPISIAHAHEPGAHVHGVASLAVAVDGKILTLDFSGPLDNLLGFEHVPRTAKQQAAVNNMATQLRKTAQLFAPSAAALCSSVSVKLESIVLDPKRKDEGDGHADIDGEYVLHCEHPEQLHDLELKLFDDFPNLHQMNVQVAGPRGQTSAKLSSTQRRVSW